DPVDGLVRLGLSLILLGIVIAISYAKRLGIGWEVGFAAGRAILQLMVVVLILTVVFESGDPGLVALVLSAMVVIAAYTSGTRAGGGIEHPLRITLPSIAIGTLVILAVLILIGVLPLEPEFLIPVGSMNIGGSMIICSLVLNRIRREVETGREQIETSLSLGATSREAVEPFTRLSVKGSLIPSIDRLRTLDIIVGTMAGMIIAGINPVWAAQYQLVILFLLMASEIITAVIATYLAERQLFTEAGQLR
ncbi:MAG TPA: iron export ABC transporter permease subunit FetB, partial [Methanolinea sp.]|nr:iron export ABC transporter permease subunit FetB [Methanolinea sp.]